MKETHQFQPTQAVIRNSERFFQWGRVFKLTRP
jgi:hypothetical protein